LTLQVLDSTLGSQIAEERTNQFVKWTVGLAEVDVSTVGTVSLLGVTPCDVGQRISVTGNNCRITGLVLDPGSAATATVRLRIEELEVVRAKRPLLTAGGDFDGDTIPDDDDNCIYVANTDQANENADEEGENPVGDACTNAGGAKDSDHDTVADVFDNCVYDRNPLQEDTGRLDDFFDGVGDACEERVEVTLPAGGAVIRRADQPLNIREQGRTVLTFDFKSNEWCGHGTTSCTLDPEDVVLTVQ
jgi:hypothetical protein